MPISNGHTSTSNGHTSTSNGHTSTSNGHTPTSLSSGYAPSENHHDPTPPPSHTPSDQPGIELEEVKVVDPDEKKIDLTSSFGESYFEVQMTST